MLERRYQAQLIKKLRNRFPGCVILINDSGQLQGILDLTILYFHTWGTLEVKADERAPLRPNQEYYVSELNKLSFAAIIYPSNEEEVLDALERSFESCRQTRISQS